MCKTYNTIGSLTVIRSRLAENNIHEFNSLFDLLEFKGKYESAKSEIISIHSKLVEKEKSDLEIKIADTENSFFKTKAETENQKNQRLLKLESQINSLPETNSKILPTIIDYYKNFVIWVKIWTVQLSFHNKLKTLNRLSLDIASQEKSRLRFLKSNFDYAVSESCERELSLLKRKKDVIEDLEKFIYGAFGEYKVAKNLATLSDEFILINDFVYQFQPAIYNRKENDYIKSIQIDHILISRAGIFIIETKNWSEKSLSSLDFHSPVKQIRRANYALFKMISNGISNSTIRLNKHHWGDRKIPVRNVIVLINSRPIEQFQFVKILTLSELRSYVEYFPPIFSIEETQSIADFFIKRSNNINPSNRITVHDNSYRQ